jgi:hypothetical protein
VSLLDDPDLDLRPEAPYLWVLSSLAPGAVVVGHQVVEVVLVGVHVRAIVFLVRQSLASYQYDVIVWPVVFPGNSPRMLRK